MVLAKITKSFTLRKDGFFTYSSGKMFNPADARFINKAVADHKIVITKDEQDAQGRFKRISGFIG